MDLLRALDVNASYSQPLNSWQEQSRAEKIAMQGVKVAARVHGLTLLLHGLMPVLLLPTVTSI